MSNQALTEVIKERATDMNESLRHEFDVMFNTYWAASDDLAKGSFKTRRDQIEAIRKLSQLGLALSEMQKALSALAQVRGL
jgi:hypothetical protein